MSSGVFARSSLSLWCLRGAVFCETALAKGKGLGFYSKMGTTALSKLTGQRVSFPLAQRALYITILRYFRVRSRLSLSSGTGPFPRVFDRSRQQLASITATFVLLGYLVCLSQICVS